MCGRPSVNGAKERDWRRSRCKPSVRPVTRIKPRACEGRRTKAPWPATRDELGVRGFLRGLVHKARGFAVRPYFALQGSAMELFHFSPVEDLEERSKARSEEH